MLVFVLLSSVALVFVLMVFCRVLAIPRVCLSRVLDVVAKMDDNEFCSVSVGVSGDRDRDLGTKSVGFDIKMSIINGMLRLLGESAVDVNGDRSLSGIGNNARPSNVPINDSSSEDSQPIPGFHSPKYNPPAYSYTSPPTVTNKIHSMNTINKAQFVCNARSPEELRLEAQKNQEMMLLGSKILLFSSRNAAECVLATTSTEDNTSLLPAEGSIIQDVVNESRSPTQQQQLSFADKLHRMIHTVRGLDSAYHMCEHS